MNVFLVKAKHGKGPRTRMLRDGSGKYYPVTGVAGPMCPNPQCKHPAKFHLKTEDPKRLGPCKGCGIFNESRCEGASLEKSMSLRNYLRKALPEKGDLLKADCGRSYKGDNGGYASCEKPQGHAGVHVGSVNNKQYRWNSVGQRSGMGPFSSAARGVKNWGHAITGQPEKMEQSMADKGDQALVAPHASGGLGEEDEERGGPEVKVKVKVKVKPGKKTKVTVKRKSFIGFRDYLAKGAAACKNCGGPMKQDTTGALAWSAGKPYCPKCNVKKGATGTTLKDGPGLPEKTEASNTVEECGDCGFIGVGDHDCPKPHAVKKAGPIPVPMGTRPFGRKPGSETESPTVRAKAPRYRKGASAYESGSAMFEEDEDEEGGGGKPKSQRGYTKAGAFDPQRARVGKVNIGVPEIGGVRRKVRTQGIKWDDVRDEGKNEPGDFSYKPKVTGRPGQWNTQKAGPTGDAAGGGYSKGGDIRFIRPVGGTVGKPAKPWATIKPQASPKTNPAAVAQIKDARANRMGAMKSFGHLLVKSGWSRMHFEAAAEAIGHAHANAPTREGKKAVEETARQMAATFRSKNPRFDGGRFERRWQEHAGIIAKPVKRKRTPRPRPQYPSLGEHSEFDPHAHDVPDTLPDDISNMKSQVALRLPPGLR